MVRSPEVSTYEVASYERNDDGVSGSFKHGDDEKHRSHESKSSKHKHKHHKHKHRRKHKKENAEAVIEEVASDAGDFGVVDPGQSVYSMENVLKADVELRILQVKDGSDNSARVTDAMLTQNEQMEMDAELARTDESTFSGSDNMHKLDNEMEEGEILDEDLAVCDSPIGVVLMDSLPVDGLDPSCDDMKVTHDVPSESGSIKIPDNNSTQQKSNKFISESMPVDTSVGKEETITRLSPIKKDINFITRLSPTNKDINFKQGNGGSTSPERTGDYLSFRLSPERVSKRSRRSRSVSRESSHHLKNSSRQYNDERRSMSRDKADDKRYAGSHQDRGHRVRRSRSREVEHRSRYAGDLRRMADHAFEKRDNRVWHEERCSRSRDYERLEYVDRRRSSSRSGKDHPGRRRSRSRGVYGDYMDRRRRSKSIESYQDRDKRRSLSRNGRDSTNRRRSRSRENYREHIDKRRRSRSKETAHNQRVNESMSYRTSKPSRIGGPDRGLAGEHRHKVEDNKLQTEDIITREESEDESASLQSEGDDVDKEVERIRLRRQAIVEKHKKQEEQLESIKNVDIIMGLGVSGSTGTGNAKILLDEHASFVSDYSKKTFNLDKGSLQNALTDRQSRLKGLGQGTPKSEEKSNDMINDYIFGESPAGGRKQVKGDGVALETSGLTDNWDDAEGYYCHRIGEVMDGRYEIAASHGRGVFSSVVRARDLKATRKDVDEVAIKIIRNNDVMLKSGQQELSILRKLDGADPENRRHCVRFFTNFDYRKHLCLVFESMHMNLREVLKKFGRNIGLNLGAVRAYAKQLFIALKHLRNCGVLHCDIKPDNMLVNEAKNVLKLCDFGSAMFSGENEITPYLVSRFYRAPEIILGLPYDHPLDMWSVGCCLYEFFTGKVLFPGPTNNDMLRLHMELKGPFPKKMLKKATFASKHFDQDYNFCAAEEDPVTKTSIKRVLANVKPKDIAALVTGQGTADENGKMLNNFRDLLDKIFMLDPEKRLTVSQALSHPFITGK